MRAGGEVNVEKQVQRDSFVEEEIDLAKYWAVINRRKWSILSLALLVTLLATLIVYSLTPLYKASSVLLIEPERQKSLSMEEMYTLRSKAKEYYLTQMEILESRSLAEKVIVELDLSHDRAFLHKKKSSFNPLKPVKKWMASIDQWLSPKEVRDHTNSVKKDRTMDRLVAKFQHGLSARLIKDTQLIKLTYTSENAALTARLANALAAAYIQDQLDARVSKTRLATDWMEKRLIVLKKSLEDSDRALQRYKERYGLIDVRGVNTLTGKELDKWTTKLLAAESSYNELAKTFGPKHPRLIAALSELQAARSGLAKSRAKMQMISKQSVKLRELQRQVNSNRELYDTFLSRLKEATQSIELQQVNARIADFAVEPERPFKPKKGMLIALAFFASLMFGVLLAFLYEALDKTFKSTADIESKLQLPILGLLPLIKDNKKDRMSQAFAMLEPNQTVFAEAMRTIRTGLVLSSLDNPHKVILITSSIPGEGKTTVSTNLAVAMSKMEKVLLIGADLRRPTLSKAVGLGGHENGLSNIVAGTADFKDCIHHLDDAGIDVLPCGLVPPNPLELLSSERFAKMLKVLETHYDRIVIDSPPMQAVSDALVLSRYAKAVVYVVEADATHEHAVTSGVKRLKEYGAPIAGVILNKFDIEKSTKYGYDYGGYYDQYGYSESKT